MAIGDLSWRQRASVEGRVRSLRVQPLAGAFVLECVIADETGAVSAVFLGRRRLAGVSVGTRMQIEGTAGEHRGRLAILNPAYELLA